MALTGFRYFSADGSGRDQLTEDFQLGASQTAVDGDAMVFTLGKLVAAGSSTTQVDFIMAESATSTATSLVKPKVMLAKNGGLFKIGFTPLLDKLACLSGGTTTSIVHNTIGYSSNDFQGGLVYSHATGETRLISASAATTGTLTVVEPLTRALVAGEKISVIPYGPGASPKLGSAGRTLSSAIADKTGGAVQVMAVDMHNRVATVRFK